MSRRSQEQVLKYINENIKTDKNGCHIWQRSCAGNGLYARLSYLNKGWNVTRLLWTLNKGEIPPNMYMLHSCDVAKCVNLEHLRMGTQAENIKDRDEKRRHASHKQTHCKYGHEFNEENTAVAKRTNGKTYRKCLVCAREYWHKRKGLK